VKAKFLFIVHFILIICNTILWCLPLYALVLVKRISPVGKFRFAVSKAILGIGENWIAFNSFLVEKSAKTKVVIHSDVPLSKDRSYLLLANHYSWVDIIVLQKAFNRKVPFLRFFLKKELFWLPFLGLAFWALDFPFMHRYSKEYLRKHPEKKGKDLEATIKTCRKIRNIPFSLINFPEGTRFTSKKHQKQNSPFQNLLKPKAGGIAFVLEAFEGNIDHILDVSIVYKNTEKIDMLNLLSGKISEIHLHVKQLEVPEHFGKKSYQDDDAYREEFQEWTNNVWENKDKRFAEDYSKA
jgi:1-acyl-sn-glycerol-3-phosphate acyltransferase